MNKRIKSLNKERARLAQAAAQLAKYLNIAQEFTGDYLETLSLGKGISQLLAMDNEKLKRIGAMIYLCREKLSFPGYEVTYSKSGFSVSVLHFDAPF